jgi:hypothetical protein
LVEFGARQATVKNLPILTVGVDIVLLGRRSVSKVHRAAANGRRRQIDNT